jgi:glucose/arabinose dehydrogenase
MLFVLRRAQGNLAAGTLGVRGHIVLKLAFAALCAVLITAAVADAAQGPPPSPKATSGHVVSVLARGIPTPTSIAFLGGQTFVAGFGDEQHPKITGGVYVLKAGKAHKVAGSPAHVFGLASTDGVLYVSGGTTAANDSVLAWSGWNGTRFTKSKVVVAAPKGFSGFNGIAVGPDGMLYAGVSLGDAPKLDYTKGSTVYANDVIRIDPASGSITVQATGLRQPWQLVFAPGSNAPLVSDLGQENLGKKRPPDYVVKASQGSDFGFPKCPATPGACPSYAKPLAQFPAHASPMGLGVLGTTLYVALFGGTGKGPEVVEMPLTGGTPKPVLTGFVAPVVALATHNGTIYAGDLTGSVYSVKP